jgi:hypothetical protein
VIALVALVPLALYAGAHAFVLGLLLWVER